MKLRILVGEYSSGSLGPHHKRVHRPFHVRRSFVAGTLGSNRYQSPVVSLKNFGDRRADPLASVSADRRCFHVVTVIVVVIIVAGVTVAGAGTAVTVATVARRNRTGCLSHDVVHLSLSFWSGEK